MTLVVDWQRADGDCGRAPLKDVLPEPAADTDLHLVLSVADVYLVEMELSRQQLRHVKQVLPFLLEETLLDNTDELLFATGNVQAGKLPVVAVAKDRLEALVTCLRDGGWRLASLTVDADLLAGRAPLLADLGDEKLLLDSGRRAWVADAAGLALYFAGDSDRRAAFAEPDRATLWRWLLDGLAARGHVELLQREWRTTARTEGAAAGLLAFWKPALLLAAGVFGVIWLALAVQTWRYSAAEARWQQASAQLFQELFPEDRATARLKAQFQGHLSRLQRGSGGADFLTLMTRAGVPLAAGRKQGVEPQRITYDQRNGQLLLDLDVPGYPQLQTLRSQLVAAHLEAEVLVAKSRDKGVSARLKVEKG